MSSTKSSFYSDTPNYATNYPTQNDSNTEPVNGNTVSPSSFYPDGGHYEINNPDVAEDYAAQAAASASSAAAHDTSAATHDTNSAASAATATTQAGIATTQATTATAEAGTATTQATNAAASATSAANHDASAATHDTNAAASATAAANSATSAASHDSSAATHDTNAATSATNAANSASSAATTAANLEASAAQPNGLATLDSGGHLAASQIPLSLVGALNYQGTWNASTNTPALASGTGTKGFYYKVSVAGATAVDGNSQWNIGDSIIFDGTAWDKIDGISSEVISVAGRNGVVVLTAADVAGALTDAPSDGNEYARKNGAWAIAAGAVSIQDTAPTGVASGSLWWNSTNGQLYVLFGTAWVAASTIASLPGTVQYDVLQALSAAQKQQAQTNIYVAPTLTKLTVGSGTYAPPAGCTWIRVRMVGGGGGGTGSGLTNPRGGKGGDTTFGAHTAVGGSASAGGLDGGLGGYGTIGAGASGFAVNGGGGTGGQAQTATNQVTSGGAGGGSMLGGGALAPTYTGAGVNPNPAGGGGSGAGSNDVNGSSSGGGGGGGGGLDIIITSPAASYSWAVGAAGAAGVAGTSGFTGGAGAPGAIYIEEHYGS